MQTVPLRLKGLKPREDDFEPQTLGEHIRKRRLVTGLNKVEAGRQLGVTGATIRHWESGQTHPPIERIPAILSFLSYDPFPRPKSIPEWLLATRRARGWSIREAAAQLGVDPSTRGDWERGKVILFRTHRLMMTHLLGLPDGEVEHAMAAAWVRSDE